MTAIQYSVSQLQKLEQGDIRKLLNELGLVGSYKSWDVMASDINKAIAALTPEDDFLFDSEPTLPEHPVTITEVRPAQVKTPAVNTAWKNQLDNFVGTLPMFLRAPAQVAMSRISPKEAEKALKWAMAVYIVSLLLDLDKDAPDEEAPVVETKAKKTEKVIDLDTPEEVPVWKQILNKLSEPAPSQDGKKQAAPEKRSMF
jgi:hypothetical protein